MGKAELMKPLDESAQRSFIWCFFVHKNSFYCVLFLLFYFSCKAKDVLAASAPLERAPPPYPSLLGDPFAPSHAKKRTPRHQKQRAAYVASRWLRAAKRAASKRALTVALAVALAFPSLSAAPRYASGGGDFAVGGASSAHSAVELVLPSSGNDHAAASARAMPASVGGGGGAWAGRAQKQQQQPRQGGGGGRTAASRAAFVGPWGEEAAGGRSSKGGSAVAAAVRAPSKSGKPSPVKDNTQDALRSMATKAGVNGREIAQDFGGHIQVWCHCWPTNPRVCLCARLRLCLRPLGYCCVPPSVFHLPQLPQSSCLGFSFQLCPSLTCSCAHVLHAPRRPHRRGIPSSLALHSHAYEITGCSRCSPSLIAPPTHSQHPSVAKPHASTVRVCPPPPPPRHSCRVPRETSW